MKLLVALEFPPRSKLKVQHGAQPFIYRQLSDNFATMSDMRDDRVTVRLSPEMRRQLKATARRRGERESDVIRTAIQRQLADEEHALTAFDRVQKSGLIGIVQGAPRDLSTNPKHFDGFGTK